MTRIDGITKKMDDHKIIKIIKLKNKKNSNYTNLVITKSIKFIWLVKMSNNGRIMIEKFKKLF